MEGKPVTRRDAYRQRAERGWGGSWLARRPGPGTPPPRHPPAASRRPSAPGAMLRAGRAALLRLVKPGPGPVGLPSGPQATQARTPP